MSALKASVEEINSVQRRVSVEVTPEDVNKAFEHALRQLRQKVRIQGFRPGKAPLSMVRKMYGGQVTSDVGEKLINGHLFQALNDQGIRPIATPMVEAQEAPIQDKPFKFSAVVDVMPQLQFDDYKGLAVKVETFKVSDELVQKEIEQLQRRHATTKSILDADPVAAEGHVATLSHEVKKADGTPVPAFSVKDMPIALGQGELFEDLEKSIYGMRAGSSKSVQITLPDDYGDEELAGETVTFDIALQDLKKLEIPEVDDEFAKDLEFESVTDMKGKIREHLETRAEDMTRQKLESAILDQILDRHPFDVPPAMVDQVIDSMINELPHPNEERRQEALRTEDLRGHFLGAAKRRTQNTLILWHVTQKEQLQATDEEIRDRVEQAVKSMEGADPRQVAKVRQNIEARLRENLIFEKAMEFLIENAKIDSVPAEL